MLVFFYSLQSTKSIKTANATPYLLESAEAYYKKKMPYDKIYVTTKNYTKKIAKALDEEAYKKLRRLKDTQVKTLRSHDNFPKEIKTHHFTNTAALIRFLGDNESINIAIFNGIGTGLGDNFAGLAALQRLQNLIKPKKIHFHILANFNIKAAEVFKNIDYCTVHHNILRLNQFMKMDFFINLNNLLRLPHFDELPLSVFFAERFMIKNLIKRHALYPLINVDKTKADNFKSLIAAEFKSKKPLLLLHATASSPLRTMPENFRRQLIDVLITSGYNVISALKLDYQKQGFIDCSTHSRSMNDFIQIISACDAVISVGTVTYHLAAALGKPTLLLPIVRADILSGNTLPEVKVYVDPVNTAHIFDIHKSRNEDDLKISNQMWHNTSAKQVVAALEQHTKHFYRLNKTDRYRISDRFSVIVHQQSQPITTAFIDDLLTIDQFDPLWLSLPNSLKTTATQHIRRSIKDAIAHVDFVCLLPANTLFNRDILTRSAITFARQPNLGMICYQPYNKQIIDTNPYIVDLPIVLSSHALKAISHHELKKTDHILALEQWLADQNLGTAYC